MEAIMEKKELLYEGKAKKVYTTENPDVILSEQNKEGRQPRPHLPLRLRGLISKSTVRFYAQSFRLRVLRHPHFLYL